MIDEKAQQIAAKTLSLSKSAIREIKSTLGCLASLYFDRVRWVEFTGFVVPPALIAAKIVGMSALPCLAPYCALFVGSYIALAYLRNPKMANWKGSQVSPDAS